MRLCFHLAHATLLGRRNGSCRGERALKALSTMSSASKKTAVAKKTASSGNSARTAAARPARPLAATSPRLRALSTEASEPEASPKEKRSSSSIFWRGRPLALLERHVSPSSAPSSSSSAPPASDRALWESGAFVCEVYPDLPVAASWRGLLRAASGGLLDSAVDAATGDAPGAGRRRRRGRDGDGGGGGSPSLAPPPPSFVVRTVAAQVRGLGSVKARIQRAAGVGPGGEPLSESGGEGEGGGSRKRVHSPDALLLLSGGHPARSLLRSPTSSLEMLRAAVELRDRGLIPRDVELWGVANPLVEEPERAAVEKAADGADAIVTQPPLSERAWLRWWEGVQRISSSSSSSSSSPGSSSASVPPVVGGLAVPNSPGAFRFWVALCGAGGVEGVDEEAAAFAQASSVSPSAQREHALSYCRKTLSFYESLGDALAGIHVMPVTGPGREITRQLLEEGALERWDWRRRRSE